MIEVGALGENATAFLEQYHAMREAVRRIDADLQAYNVSLTQADMLLALRRAEPVTIGHLANEVELASQSLTAAVDRLEANPYGSFVRRRRGNPDRRKVFVELTEAGRALADRVAPALARAVKERWIGIAAAWGMPGLENLTAASGWGNTGL